VNWEWICRSVEVGWGWSGRLGVSSGGKRGPGGRKRVSRGLRHDRKLLNHCGMYNDTNCIPTSTIRISKFRKFPKCSGFFRFSAPWTYIPGSGSPGRDLAARRRIRAGYRSKSIGSATVSLREWRKVSRATSASCRDRAGCVAGPQAAPGAPTGPGGPTGIILVPTMGEGTVTLISPVTVSTSGDCLHFG